MVEFKHKLVPLVLCMSVFWRAQGTRVRPFNAIVKQSTYIWCFNLCFLFTLVS